MKTVLKLENPVPLSVVEFDAGEELFLTMRLSGVGDYGTGIERTGDRPPTVDWLDPPHRITDPHAQRRGAWFIWDGDAAADHMITRERLGKAADPLLKADLEAMLRDKEWNNCHQLLFPYLFPEWRIKGMQGCGDLTMNYWNVAYLNGHLAPGRHFVCLRGEHVLGRVYTCLVKWKARVTTRQLVSIEEMRFAHTEGLDVTAEVLRDGHWFDRSSEIEFAISNQRVLRDSEVVPALESCEQFGDVRHLLQTPTLNPPGPLYPGERPTCGRYLPRRFFDHDQTDHIWLGENEFIADLNRNLLRAALSGPVVLPWPIGGATEQQVRGALMLGRYSEVGGTSRLLRPGEWRFRHERRTVVGLEICFRRNCYGWTLVGVSADGRRVLALACKGFPGEQRGYTLEEAAAIFCGAGAAEALLIDEGEDAFQIVNGVDQIPRPNRRRVRACFVVAEREPAIDGGSERS
ncbi:hypothetical protein [Paludibaculum fermentans]|uniref:hypothetical protein n=1 Tax=Paludibaculum fermentans TaxID=1473598 RepID=UPI003EB9E22A